MFEYSIRQLAKSMFQFRILFKTFFSAGTPYTKTTETYIYRTIDETLFFVMIAFASLGIVYGLICLLTLVLNFKKKYVYYWTVIKNQFETRNPK